MTLATVQKPTQVSKRLRVGNLGIDPVELDDVLDGARKAVRSRESIHIVTVNLQFVGEVRRNLFYRDVVNRADIVVPDGNPLVWYSKWVGSPLPDRITGFDLFNSFTELASREHYSLFILGGSPESTAASCALMRLRFPSLDVRGSYHGSFDVDGYGTTADDEDGAIRAIREARPDILFVALGCPKQELWIRNHIDQLDVPVSVGVGGVFDVMSGGLNRAPIWMQRHSLEWAYRLSQEPRRLWRRYIFQDIPTAVRLGLTAVFTRLRGTMKRRRSA